MAKVFISFLGTTPYSTVTYVYNRDIMVDNELIKKEIKTKTRFVQVASISSIFECEEWNSNDRIIIFRTERSNIVNWNDNPNYEGLNTELSNLLGSWEANHTHSIPTLNPGEDTDPTKYIVPNGFNQKELWGIFKVVFDTIKKGDEIYFDMTHAFRTIPLFTAVLFNYCRFMKDSVVKEVLYGAYEDLGEKFDLRNMEEPDKEKLEVQLVDLTEAIRLQDVNDAVSNFKQFGDMGSIVKILDEERKGKRSGNNVNVERFVLDNAIYEIQKAMRELNLYTQTCNLSKLKEGKYIGSINTQIGIIKNFDNIPAPQKELLLDIDKELSEFKFSNIDTYHNIEAAVKWLIKNNMIQQAVTLASEYIKATYYRLYDAIYKDATYKIPKEFKKYKIMDSISYILMAKKVKLNGAWTFTDDNWSSKLVDGFFEKKEVLDFIQEKSISDINPFYYKLRILRNQINHADGVSFGSFDDLNNHFSKIWEGCLKALDSMVDSNYEDISMSILWESQS